MKSFSKPAGVHVMSLIAYLFILLAFVGCCLPAVTPEPGEMIYVSEGEFVMGRTDYGDDLNYGHSDEDPQHIVSLSSYSIGKYMVTNRQFVDALNWALCNGYLVSQGGEALRNGDAYTHGKPIFQEFESTDSLRMISFNGSVFNVKFPDEVSREYHPVTDVSWYGAVAYCNWLSEASGLVPCYDLDSWQLIYPVSNGFRLPTEAEWERAAAWDENLQRHWVYGFMSDTIDESRCNYNDVGSDDNPLGLRAMPYTTPVGYYNGDNGTIDSPSPVGCYDMSGNVGQWCHDWYVGYGEGAQIDPLGPMTGSRHCSRGGSWIEPSETCRTASRAGVRGGMGFRVAQYISQ